MSVDTRHGFEDGTYVTFNDVKGMEEVNEKEFKINVTSAWLADVVSFIEPIFQVHSPLPLGTRVNTASTKVVVQ